MRAVSKGLERQTLGAKKGANEQFASPLPFDRPSAKEFAVARSNFLDKLFASWTGPPLRTAFDAGTGVGFFAGHLAESHGLQVTASDVRLSNIEEARRRHPRVNFFVGDVEDAALNSLGQFDVVTALGLLYHLENPFRAIRNLAAMSRHVLVVESLIAPGSGAKAWILDEFNGEDQAPNHVAWHLTERGIAKLLYRAGMPHVFLARFHPRHVQFGGSIFRRRTRSFLIGCRVPLDPGLYERAPEAFLRLDRAYYHRWPLRVLMRPLLDWRRRQSTPNVSVDWKKRGESTENQ